MAVGARRGLPTGVKVETFEETGQVFLKHADRASQLPGVDFSKLTAEQRKIALHRFNAESCDCGCKFTLAQCRINDSACPVSKALTAKIIGEITTAPASAPAMTPFSSSPKPKSTSPS